MLIEIGDKKIKINDKPIWYGNEDAFFERGEKYCARRNGDWKLLTCRCMTPDGCAVVSVEDEICFYTDECYRIDE